MSRTILVLAICILSSQALFAQSITLGRTSAAVPSELHEYLRDWTSHQMKNLPLKYRKPLRELHEQRDEAIEGAYKDAAFLTDDVYWQAWIDGILDKVREANPAHVAKDQRVWIAREASVNARCYGNQLLSVDLGLVAAMHSEDEVAFVVCHELAHQALDHFSREALARVKRQGSRKARKRVRELEEGSFSELEDYFKSIAFERSRHSRYGEAEADSLALVLFSNTDYEEHAPVTAMRVLAKAGQPTPESRFDLQRALSVPGAPAPDAWFDELELNPLTYYDQLTSAEREALRTHPSTEVRLANLTEQHASVKGATASVLTAAPDEPSEDILADATLRYQVRRQAARREIAAGCFDRMKLDCALLASIRGVQADSTDAWFRGVAALTLTQLIEQRNAGKFGLAVPQPDEYTPLELRPINALLRSLRGRELRTLAKDYTAAIPPSLLSPEAIMARAIIALWSNDELEPVLHSQTLLRTQFPDHSYNAWLRTLLKTNAQ